MGQRIGWIVVSAWGLFTAQVSGQTSGLLREVWEGIGGVAVADLTSSPDYPDRPTRTGYVTDFFEAPTDVLENYGQRLHGYVVAPRTGNYTFWIASDDGGHLYLSTDETPARARLIAEVQGWTSSREWGREAGQQSAPIALVAGKAYYVAALMKEGGGGDNLAVRWRMPDGTDQAPIVGTNLLPWGVSFTPPAIARQPAGTSAVEGGSATFSVELSTVGPAAFQWRRNAVSIPGAQLPELRYGPVRLADHGSRFSVVVTNRQGSVTSAEALLSVTPDVTSPVVTAVLNIGTTLLRVTFSEPVAPGSALNPANYRLSPAQAVRAARALADPAVVELTVDPLTLGAPYTLLVDRVQDQAQTPNAIAANTQVSFLPVVWAPGEVGTPPVAGTVTDVPGGADVAGSGEIGGTGDAATFAYQWVTGDFDRRVRVASFAPTDPFAAAGWMARATLEAGSPMAAVVTTPGPVGAFFLSRATAGAAAARNGQFPPNYPEMWLRLARSGNSFRGYASWDGQTWTELGRLTIAMPSTIHVGLAVGGRDAREPAAVAFRDVSDVTGGQVTTAVPRRAETLGPSARHSGLAISEIQYHPRKRADGRNGEFIEIYNGDLIDQDLTGHRLTGSVSYAFPDGYVLPAGGFAVVAREPGDLAVVHGLSGVLGPFERGENLPNDAGLVQLRDAQGGVLLEVEYASVPPWPAACDGAGHSLVLARPSFGEGDSRAWAASDRIGGSPGMMETVRPDPHATLRINEILAHTDLPRLDAIELYNHGNDPVEVGGCILTDDPDVPRFRIPDGTILTPRGFLAFDEVQLGFRLDAAGETVFLINPTLTRVLDAVRFGPQENGVASGRFPDGTPEWRRLSVPTLAAENAPFLVSDIVLNEIHYAPISRDDNDEFVELHNRTARAIDVSGWTLSDGVAFRFPAGTIMPPGAYFVIARDRERLLANAPSLRPDQVFGNFSGSLANGGERLALARPDTLVVTNLFGLTETNHVAIDVDEVTYGTGGRWGRWSDGLGSSLELIDPVSDHRQPSNWADSDETAKAPWTTIEFTGRVDHVASGVSSDRLHLLAQGPGEYLLDDIEVLDANGNARLAGGDFSGGLTGWTRQGNHRSSELSETGGVGGGRALRVVATGRGDTAVNRVRANLSSALSQNANATIRAKVRWLRGWPEFLLRTRGSGLEAFGRLEVPRTSGTPGARNSRAVENAGPAIVEVRHVPVVPGDRVPVVVTARVIDPDGVGAVALRYRVDPGTTLSSVAMRDDGTGGDAVAGDGVYSATIPGRTAGTLVAFRVEATDAHAPAVTTLFPADAPVREALVRWGEERAFGNLGVYRFWQRRADYDRLRSREPLANDNLDCTFVYGEERVIYNAEMRAKGSPWHGGSVGGDYLFAMPDDDRLLGARDLAVVTLGNLGSDPSAQREQAAFWIGRQLGIPVLHRRHVLFFENGGFKGLYEDTEEPNGLYADRRFPEGEDGDLYKIEDWFEFDDSGNSFVFSRDATLERFSTVGGALKLGRYRWAWRKRAVVESANNYAHLFALVEALNTSTTNYVPLVESLVDVDAWLRVFALQHIVGNWDAYGYNRGKNSYAYLPRGDRWKMIPWDIDFVLGSGSDDPRSDVFGSNDPTVVRLWNTPAFRRVYWRAFQDAVRGPLREEVIGPVLDARHAALTANGHRPAEGTGGIKNYVNARRSYLAGRLQSEDVTALVITTRGGANFSTNRNLVRLEGQAPIAVATLAVNGVPFPATWPSLTTWNLTVPLAAAENPLRLTGLDRLGREIPGLSDTISIRYTGALPDPSGFVVINEIQFDPLPGRAEFVELHNASPSGAFDLSGWRLEGAGFTFPPGTLLPGGGYLVVTSDPDAFRAEYGSGVLPAGVFAGTLQNEGEVLRVIQPGAAPGADRIIDEVAYSGEPPWPTQSRNQGPSLQLIDPLQDNRRPANWAAASPTDPVRATPGRPNSVRATLAPFPDLWINEVLPSNTAADGRTDAAGDRDPWVELHNAGPTTIDLAGLRLAASATDPNPWAFPAGASVAPGQFVLVWCDGEPGESTATEWHTSFRLPPTNGAIVLIAVQGGRQAGLDALVYPDPPPGTGWGSVPDADPLRRFLLHQPTPAAPNRRDAPPTSVLINEWMASNQGVLLDPADGDADDWFELYNAGTRPADLSAFTLTDSPSLPDKYRIPNGTVLPPGGYLLVWADEEPAQTTRDQVHTNFRLSGSGEFLGLYGPDGRLLDGLTFGAQSNNVAQGRFPDGGPEPFVFLDLPTPAGPNALASANQPPVLGPLGGQAVDEGQTITFQATASDADLDQQLRFSLLGSPEGARIDEASGVFVWATDEADGPGEFTVTVRVTDSGHPPRFDSRAVVLTVREVNQPPVLEPLAGASVDEGQTLALPLVARDPDLPPQRLTFTFAEGAPNGATLDPVGGRFLWTPTEPQGPGTYTLVFAVTDDGSPPRSATQSVAITVREVDNPPDFEPLSLQTIDEGQALVVALRARDPDTPPVAVRYQLDTAPPGAEVDPATGDFRWTPGEADGPGSFNVVARALQEDGGPEGTLAFSIIVNERNQAPELGPVPDADVAEGTTLAFVVRARDTDLPAQRLTFRLEAGAPAGASLDPDTGEFRWAIPADAGASTNRITVTVEDNAVPPASRSATFTVVVRAVMRIVINEIHYAPTLAGTEFVELHNPSGTTSWDLSGWRLTGLEFVFPAGTVLAPDQHLAVARNLTAFRAAFGTTARAVGNASPGFSAEGTQWVRLQRPRGADDWETLDEVAFLRTAPWPAAANGGGASLQLVDPAQDNRRVANWAALAGVTTNAPRNVVTLTNVWRYRQDGPAPANWRDPGFNDSAWPAGRAILHVEDAALPGPKNTALTRTEGRMTYYFRTRFDFDGQPEGAALVLQTLVDDGAVVHLNGREIFRLGVDSGTTVTDTTAASRTVPDATLEGPFRLAVTNLVRGENVLAVEVHQVNAGSSDIVWGATVDVLEVKREPVTPGDANSVRERLEPFPEIWLSEVLVRNTAGLADGAGDRDPWLEIWNAGTNAVDLAGWWLTEDLARLNRWAFPGSSLLGPGAFRLAWLDGEASEATGTEWHAGFTPPVPRGVIALVRPQNGRPAVVDFLSYDGAVADQAFGILAGADPLVRGRLAVPTPGTVNAANRPPVLDPIAAQETAVGIPILLDVRATDPDPGQTVRFSLATPSPSGATLDPLTGRFLWTPRVEDVGTHTVTVWVEDDGEPRLGAVQSFVVVVIAGPPPPPDLRITGFRVEPGAVARLTWSSVAGRSYQVEESATVEGAWTPVAAFVVATGGSTTTEFPVPAGSRFYRVRRGD